MMGSRGRGYSRWSRYWQIFLKLSKFEQAAKFVRCRKSEERQKVKDEIAIMNVLDHSKLLQLAAA